MLFLERFESSSDLFISCVYKNSTFGLDHHCMPQTQLSQVMEYRPLSVNDVIRPEL